MLNFTNGIFSISEVTIAFMPRLLNAPRIMPQGNAKKITDSSRYCNPSENDVKTKN